MKKRIKMVLYGEPGVGKSTFASKAPNPLFICSDGNFEWLGLSEEHGVSASTWVECKKILNNDTLLAKYDTIILDLTEDFFKFCEYEYCARNKIEHLSDLGYGKAYDATRNEFFIEMCKLFSRDANIILIMHGFTGTVKDRRGVEHTRYMPSSRMPDKLLDMIEGRVRYFLRCYLKDIENEDGSLTKCRYLSLVPKPDEYGIARCIDEANTPYDIPLDWNEFIHAINFDDSEVTKVTPAKVQTPTKKVDSPTIETTIESTTETTTEVETPPVDSEKTSTSRRGRKPKVSNSTEPDPIQIDLNDALKDALKRNNVEIPEDTPPFETKEEVKEIPQNDTKARLAALKAKLEAKNLNK